jgi:hypothetical protein
VVYSDFTKETSKGEDHHWNYHFVIEEATNKKIELVNDRKRVILFCKIKTLLV